MLDNSGIEVFDSTGHFLRVIGGQDNDKLSAVFSDPVAMTFDFEQNLVILDNHKSTVQIIDKEDNPLLVFGSPGYSAGQFSNALGLTTDNDGNFVVSDTSNHRIQVFTAQGTWIRALGSLGSEIGQLKEPTSCAIDPVGSFVVWYVFPPSRETTSPKNQTSFSSPSTSRHPPTHHPSLLTSVLPFPNPPQKSCF